MNDSSSTSIGAAAARLVRVSAAPDVGEARRQAADLAQRLGFAATPAGQLALGINEAGRNIVKHAGEGLLLLRALEDEGEAAIEVLALDRGAGIANVAECMRDGYSTAGSPGTGLGALARLDAGLRIISHPGKGTALRFVVRARPAPTEPPRALALGAVCVPKGGETACGDAWTLVQSAGRHTLLVVDGLGHGAEAAAAAYAAIDLTLRQSARLSAAELIEALHAGLRATRGAAGAAILLDPGRGTGVLCGIGNIAVAVRHAGATRRLVSHNGILGHQVRKIQEFPFAFPPGALLVAHSDGLDTRWRLEDYPRLENAHPALIAGVLFRDHERRRDDATVVVARNIMGIAG